MQYKFLILNYAILLLLLLLVLPLLAQEKKAEQSSGGSKDVGKEGEKEPAKAESESEVQERPAVTWTIFKNLFHERISQIREFSNTTYQNTIVQIKNYSQRNEEIAQILVKNFQDRINKTEQYLDDQMKKLMKDFEENRKIVKNLTEVVIFWRVDKLDDEIELLKQQIYDKLEHIPTPKTICGNYQSCEYCTKNPNCIWCPDYQSCAAGNDMDGSYFFECEFFQYQICNRNAQKLDKEWLMKQPPQRIIKKDILVDGVLSNDQRDYYISKQQEVILLKNKIEDKRVKINKLMTLFYKIRQKELARSELETRQYYNQEAKEDPFKDDDLPFLKYIEDDEDLLTIPLPASPPPAATEPPAAEQQQKNETSAKSEDAPNSSAPAASQPQKAEEEKKSKTEDSQKSKKLDKKLAKEPEKQIKVDVDTVEQTDQDILEYINGEIEKEKKLKQKQQSKQAALLQRRKRRILNQSPAI